MKSTLSYLISSVITLLMVGCGSLLPTATPMPPTSTPIPTETLIPTLDPDSALALVKDYETTINKHDLSGLMALLSEKVTFTEIEWSDNFDSRKAVENGYGFYFGINLEIHLSDCQVNNDTVTCHLTYDEDCLHVAGVHSYPLQANFTINSGKISKITWHDPNYGSPAIQTYNTFETNFFNWYYKTYKDEWQRVTGPSYSNFWHPENGPLIDQRCKEYADTLK